MDQTEYSSVINCCQNNAIYHIYNVLMSYLYINISLNNNKWLLYYYLNLIGDGINLDGEPLRYIDWQILLSIV